MYQMYQKYQKELNEERFTWRVSNECLKEYKPKSESELMKVCTYATCLIGGMYQNSLRFLFFFVKLLSDSSIEKCV